MNLTQEIEGDNGNTRTAIWRQRVPLVRRRWLIFSAILFPFVGVFVPIFPKGKGIPPTLWDVLVLLTEHCAEVRSISEAFTGVMETLFIIAIVGGPTVVVSLILGAVLESVVGICSLFTYRRAQRMANKPS